MTDREEPSLDAVELGDRAARELEKIGERREVRIAGIRLSGRRRRPSGERPPLPHDLLPSGRLWLVAALAMLGVWISLFAFPESTDWWTRQDLKVLRWLEDLRNDTLTAIARGFQVLGSIWVVRPLRWAAILFLIFFRRWRSLFTAIGAMILVGSVMDLMKIGIARPRPMVEMIGEWSGYSHPSRPVASFALTVILIGLATIPAGRWRNAWYYLSAALIVLLGVSRMYLGVDHPSDFWTAAVFGPAVVIIVFRIFVPESVFPVTYKRGQTAHLDVGGARGQAIREALSEQLGFEALEIQPFGLESSGGSTPLRIKVSGDPDQYVFGKLYASSHLRSDRWYKVARTILYGALEDEVRFTSVRRLVEYEDYMLLLLSRAGLPSPTPHGFVEITPEREYLIITEFLEGAQEMTDAEIADETIDDALLVVRRMWDAGLAHRDIKPANVMVRDDKVVLIDPAFSTVRPSPWRQAVDLANMMLILAMGSSADRVYRRALRFFAPGDIAEAFAASRGVTIPSQSRHALAQLKRSEGLDLIEQFRALAPHREQIIVQRWSPRRIILALGALLGLLFLLSIVIDNIRGLGFV